MPVRVTSLRCGAPHGTVTMNVVGKVESTMWAKLGALISSKVALATIGGVLVVGAGATAMAVTHLPAQSRVPGLAQAQPTAHGVTVNGHVAIQGTLTGYNTATTPHTIQVTGRVEDLDSTHGEAPATATVTHDPACSLKSPYTIRVSSTTRIDGDVEGHPDRDSSKPADPLAAALAAHSGVEVQATEDSSCLLTASKVTITAPQPQRSFVGMVATVGAASFTLQRAHDSTLTVNVSSATTFEGAAHSLAGLKHGMFVLVVGTQPDATTVDASRVASAGSFGEPGSGQGRWTFVYGTITSVGTGSFVVRISSSTSITVEVTSTTTYFGAAHSFQQLKAGMRVAAEGQQQADGSVQATHVGTSAADSQG